MAEIKTLQDLFVRELRETYDAEKQLLKALRRMARAARLRCSPDAALYAHEPDVNRWSCGIVRES